MSLNERLSNYFLNEDGIDKIFINLGHVTAAGVLFGFIPDLVKENLAAGILLVLFSLALLPLSAIYGIKKVLLPLLKAIYGNNERFSSMESSGWRGYLNIQFAIYLFVAGLYFYTINALFSLVSKA